MINDPCRICIVCGSSHMKKLYSVRDTNQDVSGVWDIVACTECGNGVLSPFPTAKEIESFYRDVFYTDDGKRFRGWMEKLRLIVANLRGGRLNQICPKRGKLMDFGSGAGHFAASQAKKGWLVESVDPYSAASNNANSVRLDESSFKLLYPDNYFDAITLWYVIEHLRDPDAALDEFMRVLKPNGVLILAQQDFASLQAKFFKQNWLFLDPPRHLWQFTAKGVADIAKKHGFELIENRWANIEMSPFCMLQSTLNMLIGNNNYLFRFLKNRKLSNETSTPNAELFPTFVSIALLPVLAPIILISYFLLLYISSGDVVTVYLRKKDSL